MRWLVIFCVLALASGTARALVILDPPMVRRCPSGKTFDAVTSCLAKHVTVKVVRQLPNARLLALSEKTAGGQLVETGLLLYVQRKQEWRVGGYWRGYGDYQLLAFQPLTIGKHAGYRIDVGHASPFMYLVDNLSPVRATLRMKRVLFCSGDSYGCPDVTTLCEVLVHGSAVAAFHGSLAIEDNAIAIKGDRSKAGAHCNVAPRTYIGWRQP
jgi:hypothetical protein